MAGTTSNNPSFSLKCPNCGLSTQYDLLELLKTRLKDRDHIDFYCEGCGYSRLLTTGKFPGLTEALGRGDPSIGPA